MDALFRILKGLRIFDRVLHKVGRVRRYMLDSVVPLTQLCESARVYEITSAPYYV